MTTEIVEGQKLQVRIEVPRPFSGWQDEFVRCMADRIAVKAGRQSAKTFGFTIKSAMVFLGSCLNCLGIGCRSCEFTGKMETLPVLYAAPTTQQLDRFWYETVNIFTPAIESGVLHKDETEHTIEVPGTEIRIKAITAWNANTLRGGNWGLIGLDEFQIMNEDIWPIVIPMLMRWNGQLVILFTPPSMSSEGISKAKDYLHASKTYREFLKDTTGRWKCFHATSYDNPYLAEKALKNISTDMKSEDSYRREILAQDDEIEQSWLVYGRFDDALCKIKRFPIPDNWLVYSGHDFGEANHVALFVAQVRLPLPSQAPIYLRLGDYVVFAEYVPPSGVSAERHIEAYKDIMGRKDDGTLRLKLERAVGGNVTTEEEIRKLYRRLGWAIMAPDITRVKLQIDRALAIVEQQQVYIFDDLYNLLKEIHSCMWEIDPATKLPLDKIKGEAKYHALACFVEGTMITTDKGQVPIERIKDGDKVLTRQCYQEVAVAGETSDNAETITAYFSNGATLTGTPDHPVFVKGRGWISLTSLRYGDICKSPYRRSLRKDDVLSVEATSCAINISRQESAQSDVKFLHAKPHCKARVYNLSVENIPEYYANGILVHNCFRYLATVLIPKVPLESRSPQVWNL